MNLRVGDMQACYERWRSNGAEFVTPPIDRGAEIRCYMRWEVLAYLAAGSYNQARAAAADKLTYRVLGRRHPPLHVSHRRV